MLLWIRIPAHFCLLLFVRRLSSVQGFLPVYNSEHHHHQHSYDCNKPEKLHYRNDDIDVTGMNDPVLASCLSPDLYTSSSVISVSNSDSNSKKQRRTKYDLAWEERYRELNQFYFQHGHCNVPSKYEDGSLSRWVSNQRRAYKLDKSSMTQERYYGLQALNFTWSKYVTRTTSTHVSTRDSDDDDRSNIKVSHDYDEAWEYGYEQLLEYRNENGHCNVPLKYVHRDDIALGRWVDTQRIAYRQRKKQNQENKASSSSSMTRTRISLLEDIGFTWDPNERQWMERMGDLYYYKHTYGDCHVNSTINPQLYVWTNKQREQYHLSNRNQNIKMPLERINALNQIGFAWEDGRKKKRRKSKRTPWTVRFLELKEFHQSYGHCVVPQHYLRNPELGIWVKAQRRQYKLKVELDQPSGMNQSRIQMLNSIGFVWEVTNWEVTNISRNVEHDEKLKQKNKRLIQKTLSSTSVTNGKEYVIPFDIENKTSKQLHSAWKARFREYR